MNTFGPSFFNMKIKNKKRITYVAIGLFFLLGGIEYAVILPTLWLYLEKKFNSQPYMLGVVLSAFSFSSLLCAPLFGSWSDRTGNTKLVLLFANVFSIAGSFMYTLGISDWFLVGSRLVAGMGAGVGSALFGDIGRTTSVAERTSIMSLFMAVRQFGLLAVSSADPVNDDYVFMACLWVLHEIFVIFLFWNLPTLKSEQEKEVIKENMQYPTSGSNTSINSEPEDHSSSIFETTSSPVPSDRVSINHYAINNDVNADHGEDDSEVRPCTFQLGSQPLERQISVISTSSEAIVNAEKYISTSPGYLQYSEAFAQHTSDANLNNQEPKNSNARESSNNTRVVTTPVGSPVHSNDIHGTRAPIKSEAAGSGYGACNNIKPETGRRQSQQKSSELDSGTGDNCDSNKSNKPNIKITRQFLYNEFIREEVIIILATVFTAFFSQLVLETICTPLTKKLLGWGELENSFLYCGAGLEILLVFILISWLSKRIPDRYLLLLGYILLVVTLSFMTWFIPQERPNEKTKTLVGLLFGISLDIFSLPFLAVVGTSLYSKITRPETQGLSQGIRRISTGIATILGPLWAGGMLQHLYIMFGVCLGVCILVMIMLLMSFKHLKVDQQFTTKVPRTESNLEEEEPLIANA